MFLVGYIFKEKNDFKKFLVYLVVNENVDIFIVNMVKMFIIIEYGVWVCGYLL